MKNLQTWKKPTAEKIILDKEVSILLQSPTPPGDPFQLEAQPTSGFNPFK